MSKLEQIIQPDWPAPMNVRALMTTRRTTIDGQTGVSVGAYGDAHGGVGLNVATHVGDDSLAMSQNRQWLRRILPSEPL